MRHEIVTFRIAKSQKRGQAHSFFDKIWKTGLMDRASAYTWLSEKLNLNTTDCHFSRMKSADILKAIRYSIEYLNQATLQRLTDFPTYELIMKAE